jgi:uncharacterized low-complexity protein
MPSYREEFYMTNIFKLILAGAILVAIPAAVSAQTKQAQATDQQKKNKEECEKKGKGPGECGGG